MTVKISSRGRQVSPFIVMEVLRQANRRAVSGKDVLHLELGQPSEGPPAPVLAAAAVAGRPDAAQALILGGQGLGQQAFFSYSRVQESAADQAALKYLDQAGISTKGLYEFISVLAQQELRLPGRQHPYMRTHPVTQERVDIIHNHLQKSPYRDESLRPELVETHERIRAKLRAFIEDPETTIRRYEDDRGFNGRYARAIAYYRDSKIDRSIEITDGLIRENPDNPYLHELRGQILFENGRIAEAAESYQQAVALYPRNSLLRTALGQAQVATNDPALEAKSVVNLREAVRLEQDNAMAWYFLAVAEGRSGNMGLAALAQAEHALLIGKPGDARSFATRAQRHLDEHSPAWLRAEDILTALKAGRGRR